ncbi:Superoxide dismutase [Cu-Zn] precursor [Deinococcus marmoris]|uniref:Superoxide dismutase [Cu-Zn] n=2 Tax=Deinococcus marmoris TaxID=249408 RepID=A0A1U7NW16_9DEIO|nr:Superoxide dismutase [Cu-Zn] precursor [Deinococcus marmoris]
MDLKSARTLGWSLAFITGHMKKLLTAAALTLALASCGPETKPPVETEMPDTVTSYTLPGNTVFPEGIAHLAGSQNFYVGSTTDGTIFKGTLGQKATEVFALPDADRTTAIGMKIDDKGRLYVAGGDTGKAFVYDTVNKTRLKLLTTPAAKATFINDVTLTPDAAYFTDSQRPILFRATRTDSSVGDMEAWLDFTGTALQYQPGFNLNGIASTPDGSTLIVVQSNTGKLFRIKVSDKSVTEIKLSGVGGNTVPNGDGILLNGQTLYVVRNQDVIIVPVTMSADFSTGRLGTPFSDPSLRYPTTIAQEGKRLLVVNAQFNNRGTGLTPEVPFTVSDIAIK